VVLELWGTEIVAKTASSNSLSLLFGPFITRAA
jgi:hypothetical protein